MGGHRAPPCGETVSSREATNPLGRRTNSPTVNRLPVASACSWEIAKAIAGASPDQLLKLKNAETQFSTRMKELDIDLERINAEDRDSARKRQVETGDNTPTILAMMLSAAFFGLLGSMMFFEIPDSNRDLLNIMVGVLGAAWTAAMS